MKVLGYMMVACPFLVIFVAGGLCERCAERTLADRIHVILFNRLYYYR